MKKKMVKKTFLSVYNKDEDEDRHYDKSYPMVTRKPPLFMDVTERHIDEIANDFREHFNLVEDEEKNPIDAVFEYIAESRSEGEFWVWVEDEGAEED